jgi:hypothetical protein
VNEPADYYTENFTVSPSDTELRNLKFSNDKHRLAESDAAEYRGDDERAQTLRRIIGD